jgi:antitoxin component YwqK of YwqJK toxin-antitoxin module
MDELVVRLCNKDMKKLLAAMFVAMMVVGCGESSTSVDLNVSAAITVQSEYLNALDLDDNETLTRVLREATDLDSLRTFSVGGPFFYYSPNDENPNTGLLYSGWGKEMYGNGKVCRLSQFVDGKMNGISAEWYYNGKKEVQSIIKEGNKHGLHTSWYENGRKRRAANYTEGKMDGLSTEWYRNGHKKSEESFNNDKLISSVAWKPNGEKCFVTNVKDGTGFFVQYAEDSTEIYRTTWKDGERVD